MVRRTLLATLMLTLGAAGAMAQDVRLYGARDAVDPRDVAAILGQPMKMRSIRLLDDPPVAVATPPQLVAAAPQAAAASTTFAARDGHAAKAPPAGPPGALALPVQFAFASADILPSARQQLDALAEEIGRAHV